MKKKYDVVGMTCSACSAHVDKAVRGLDGVDDVNVNLLQNSMTVEFDENKLSESQIFEAVDKAGYKAQNIGEKQVSNVQENENEHKKKNLILSFIFLIPLFYISVKTIKSKAFKKTASKVTVSVPKSIRNNMSFASDSMAMEPSTPYTSMPSL